MKIKKTIKQNTDKPAFVAGYALQNYSSAEKGIIDAYENGYQYWYIDASLSLDAHNKWNVKRIDNMIGLIEKHNIYPLIHGNFKVPLGSDVDELRNAAIEYTKREIDLASALSAPLIIHGGAIVEPRLVRKAKNEAINNFLSSLNVLCRYANTKKVELYLENLSNYKNLNPFHYVFTHEEEFDFIFTATDIKFFLDLGHANIGNPSPKSIFEKFYKRIVGMSFSNNNGHRDQHRSLSKGTIDYKQIIASIIFTEWKGIVAFEIRDNDPDICIRELKKIHQNSLNIKNL
jgi:L-ribulose-5-phosphate 3-epimerase